MNTQKTLEFDYDQPIKTSSDHVVCLGMTFENDEDRRKYFTGKLREKLQDPEFRKIEGFPIEKVIVPLVKFGRGVESLKTESERISQYIHQILGCIRFFGIDL